jgi:hypothetical protein
MRTKQEGLPASRNTYLELWAQQSAPAYTIYSPIKICKTIMNSSQHGYDYTDDGISNRNSSFYSSGNSPPKTVPYPSKSSNTVELRFLADEQRYDKDKTGSPKVSNQLHLLTMDFEYLVKFRQTLVRVPKRGHDCNVF